MAAARGLTVHPAMHGSPCKSRLGFCGSSEKLPLAITLMAGASAGLAVGTNARVVLLSVLPRGSHRLLRLPRPRRGYRIPRRHLVILGKSLTPHLCGFSGVRFRLRSFYCWMASSWVNPTDSCLVNRMILVRLCQKLQSRVLESVSKNYSRLAGRCETVAPSAPILGGLFCLLQEYPLECSPDTATDGLQGTKYTRAYKHEIRSTIRERWGLSW
jgi:hypothetical protein